MTELILGLDRIVKDLAQAFTAIDAMAPQGRSRTQTYQPGIGPLTEAEAVKQALVYLSQRSPTLYASAAPLQYPGSRQTCDIVIPQLWAIECKLIRPFGDNGKEAEHWSENVLHPYRGNTSTVGDCIKLAESAFVERKAVIVFGYEHTPPLIPVEPAIRAFELIAVNIAGIMLGPRHAASFKGLIHPYHQQGEVFGWEVLTRSTADGTP